MEYLLIFYEAGEDFEARTAGDRSESYWGGWSAYSRALSEAGVLRGGAALKQPSTGTTVRLRSSERLVQDGPFADTKEQLGGFMRIDVPDLDAALEWAARCPAAASGAVEVRPVLPMTSGSD